MTFTEYIAFQLRRVRRLYTPPTVQDREQFFYMHSHYWDAVTLESDLRYGWAPARVALANAGRAFKWREVKRLLAYGGSPNEYQVCTPEWNTCLHWAAEANAPLGIVRAIISSGAWRSLPNADGQRPIDIALACGHQDLIEILEPQYVRPFESETLARTQAHFHAHLLTNELVVQHRLRLPELVILMELTEPKMSFAVPGMYGNYIYWLDDSIDKHTIVFEITCRVVSGPVPRYECSPNGLRRLPSIRSQ